MSHTGPVSNIHVPQLTTLRDAAAKAEPKLPIEAKISTLSNTPSVVSGFRHSTPHGGRLSSLEVPPLHTLARAAQIATPTGRQSPLSYTVGPLSGLRIPHLTTLQSSLSKPTSLPNPITQSSTSASQPLSPSPSSSPPSPLPSLLPSSPSPLQPSNNISITTSTSPSPPETSASALLSPLSHPHAVSSQSFPTSGDTSTLPTLPPEDPRAYLLKYTRHSFPPLQLYTSGMHGDKHGPQRMQGDEHKHDKQNTLVAGGKPVQDDIEGTSGQHSVKAERGTATPAVTPAAAAALTFPSTPTSSYAVAPTAPSPTPVPTSPPASSSPSCTSSSTAITTPTVALTPTLPPPSTPSPAASPRSFPRASRVITRPARTPTRTSATTPSSSTSTSTSTSNSVSDALAVRTPSPAVLSVTQIDPPSLSQYSAFLEGTAVAPKRTRNTSTTPSTLAAAPTTSTTTPVFCPTATASTTPSVLSSAPTSTSGLPITPAAGVVATNDITTVPNGVVPGALIKSSLPVLPMPTLSTSLLSKLPTSSSTLPSSSSKLSSSTTTLPPLIGAVTRPPHFNLIASSPVYTSPSLPHVYTAAALPPVALAGTGNALPASAVGPVISVRQTSLCKGLRAPRVPATMGSPASGLRSPPRGQGSLSPVKYQDKYHEGNMRNDSSVSLLKSPRRIDASFNHPLDPPLPQVAKTSQLPPIQRNMTSLAGFSSPQTRSPGPKPSHTNLRGMDRLLGVHNSAPHAPAYKHPPQLTGHRETRATR